MSSKERLSRGMAFSGELSEDELRSFNEFSEYVFRAVSSEVLFEELRRVFLSVGSPAVRDMDIDFEKYCELLKSRGVVAGFGDNSPLDALATILSVLLFEALKARH